MVTEKGETQKDKGTKHYIHRLFVRTSAFLDTTISPGHRFRSF